MGSVCNVDGEPMGKRGEAKTPQIVEELRGMGLDRIGVLVRGSHVKYLLLLSQGREPAGQFDCIRKRDIHLL